MPKVLKYTAATLLPPILKTGTIQQQTTGDCYLVSALDALRHSPAVDAILNQIQIEEIQPVTAEDDIHYIVRFPSGLTGEFDAGEIGKERDGKKPLEGPWGWQMLELAYAKATRSERNKKRDNPFADDGRGHTPEIAEIGAIEDALCDMLGGEQHRLTCTEPTGTKPFITERGGYPRVKQFLCDTQQNPSYHYILGAATPAITETEKTIELKTMQNNKPVVWSFPRQHAYSIRSFVKSDGSSPPTITVADPHDTAHKVYTLSLDEFCRVFHNVAGIALPKSFGTSQETENIQVSNAVG